MGSPGSPSGSHLAALRSRLRAAGVAAADWVVRPRGDELLEPPKELEVGP